MRGSDGASKRMACAHVLTSGGVHLRVLDHFRNMVRSAMLPHDTFLTDMFLVEDGSEGGITVNFLEALDILRDGRSGLCETRRVKSYTGKEGAQAILAFEAGRLSTLLDANDRIIVFTDNDSLRSELEPLGVRFIMPSVFESHEAWWALRERGLLHPVSEDDMSPLVLEPPEHECMTAVAPTPAKPLVLPQELLPMEQSAAVPELLLLEPPVAVSEPPYVPLQEQPATVSEPPAAEPSAALPEQPAAVSEPPATEPSAALPEQPAAVSEPPAAEPSATLPGVLLPDPLVAVSDPPVPLEPSSAVSEPPSAAASETPAVSEPHAEIPHVAFDEPQQMPSIIDAPVVMPTHDTELPPLHRPQERSAAAAEARARAALMLREESQQRDFDELRAAESEHAHRMRASIGLA